MHANQAQSKYVPQKSDERDDVERGNARHHDDRVAASGKEEDG
jgi:hypothetical protein